jgi:SagB-type dehydrogenase family enzyme
MPGAVRLLYRFGADVRSIDRKANRITLEVDGRKPVAMAPPQPAYADAIMALHGRGLTLAAFIGMVRAAGDPAEADKAAAYYVGRFARARLLAWTVADDRDVLAEVTSLSADYRPRTAAPSPDDRLALCRLACLRRDDGRPLIDSAIVRARATLSTAGVQALADSIARPRAGSEDAFAGAMWQLGFFDLSESRESNARRSWEFHDLMMHEGSRLNRSLPHGATYRFKDRFDAPPAIAPARNGDRIDLPPIDTARLGQASRPLDVLQAQRRTIKRYAAQAITLTGIGEFLWRVGRTTGRADEADLISRPYPSAGSLNELELYVAVRRCEGLSPAVYHYDSHAHGLTRLPGSAAIAARIVERSARTMALPADAQPPDLTIVITSRLPRLAWKYQGVAYRLSLLNVGVVFELMYLVATDMGLAPCANGSGDSRLLHEALGGDPFEEVAIGEFCVAIPATD